MKKITRNLFFFATALGSVLIASTFWPTTTQAQTKPNAPLTVTPDDLPRPMTNKDRDKQVANVHNAVVQVRILGRTQNPYYRPIGDPHFYGAATLVTPPGMDDEPGVLLTAIQLVRQVKSIEVRRSNTPDSPWLKAEVLYSDPDAGFAILEAKDLDLSAMQPVPVESGTRPTWEIFSTSFNIKGFSRIDPIMIGERGEDSLAFYTELANAPYASLGAPIFDHRISLIGIVGLITTSEDRALWMLPGMQTIAFLNAFAHPHLRSKGRRVKRESLNLTNPLDPLSKSLSK